MEGRSGLAIHSFRVVFELERRIHKVDRWRIPVPYGVPLRGIAYWAAALAALVLLGRLPVTSTLTGALPAPVRLVVAPIAAAYALNRVVIDGRPAHAALLAWVRWRVGARRTAALRAVATPGTIVRLAEVCFLPDERSARYRAALIEGPARVLLRNPAHAQVRGGRRRTLHVRALPGHPLLVGKEVRLRTGQRMVVRA